MALGTPTGGAGLTTPPTPSAPKAPSPLQHVVNGILGGSWAQQAPGGQPGAPPPYPANPSGGAPVSGVPGAPITGTAWHAHAPAPKPPTPAPAAKPPLPDPRDSTYYGNIAANTFKTNSQINATELNRAENDQALQAALAQLRYAQPRAQLALEQHANANNSLYSSPYGQSQGNLAYQYMGKEGGVEQKYGNEIMQDALKIAGLRAGEPLYNAQQYSDAAARAAVLASKNKALGQQPAFPTGKVPGMGGRGRGRGRGPASNPRNGKPAGRVTKPGKSRGGGRSRGSVFTHPSKSGGAGL